MLFFRYKMSGNRRNRNRDDSSHSGISRNSRRRSSSSEGNGRESRYSTEYRRNYSSHEERHRSRERNRRSSNLNGDEILSNVLNLINHIATTNSYRGQRSKRSRSRECTPKRERDYSRRHTTASHLRRKSNERRRDSKGSNIRKRIRSRYPERIESRGRNITKYQQPKSEPIPALRTIKTETSNKDRDNTRSSKEKSKRDSDAKI